MKYNIIGSTSQGNAIVYHKEIMVDCGMPYGRIKPIMKDLKIVLLTHRHKDHLLASTINRLAFERPTLLWGVPKHLVEDLKFHNIEIPEKNMIILEAGKVYKMGEYTFSPINLYHDVPNFGYRIIKGDYKILHATDTKTLKGIRAKGYDLYALEHNYQKSTIQDVILSKISKGQYAYEIRAIDNHLSFEEAKAFFEANKKETSKLIPLHISNRYSQEELKEAGVI